MDTEVVRVKEQIRERRAQKNQIGQFLGIKKELADHLRQEAAKNPVFSSYCHILAMRERSRSQITLHNLMSTMKKEGFNFPSKDYEKLLLFLGSEGVGTIDKDYKDKLRSLKNIKYGLQQIGLAALSKDQASFKPQKSVESKPIDKPQVTLDKVKQYTTKVSVTIFDRTVTIDMTPENAARYLIDLLDKSKSNVGVEK